MKQKRHRPRDRKKQLLIAAIAFAVAVAALILLGVFLDRADIEGEQQSTGAYTVVSSRATLEENGIAYRMRSRLTSILLMGVDKQSTAEEPRYYRTGGQVDFLQLLVFDDDQKRIYRLEIDRDTMAEMVTVSALGRENGKRTAQICLAHAYGNTQLYSNSLQTRAVQGFLEGAQIDYSISMTLDGIPVLNDWFGGVTVTLEDDFSNEDPAWTAGATVTLRGAAAETFVRSRQSIGDGKNTSRMRRQRQYLNTLTDMAKTRFAAAQSSVGDLYDALDAYITTDISRGRLVNTVWAARDYEVVTVTIEGEHRYGEDGYMQFLPDEASVRNAVLTMFYEKITK